MHEKILAAVDGSPITGKVLRAAVDVARAGDAELHIVYVIETGWGEGDTSRELVIRELEKESADLLSKLAKEVRNMGMEPTFHIRRGHPGDSIVNCVRDISADLIVIGSVGKSQINRILSGSVSTFVVTHSPVATLVIKP